MSVRKVKNKKGQDIYRAEVFLGTDPITGKKNRKVKEFKKSTDAKDWERTTVSKYKAGDLVINKKITLKEFINIWFDTYVNVNCSPQTISRYETLADPIINKLGLYKLSQLRTLHIDKLYADMKKETLKRKSGEIVRRYADGTILKTHKVFKSALDKAIGWEYIDRNPATRASPPKDDDREINFWSFDEGLTFLNNIKSEYIWLPCIIAFYTGLRIGEVLALKWVNVDLEEGLIKVRSNIIQDRENCKWMVVDKVKTKSSVDDVYLPDELHKILSDKKAEYPDDEFVCRGISHEFMTPTYVSQRFKKLVKRFDMTPITFHGLRHSHASILFEEGASSQEISKRLRHSRVSTTDNIYIHVDKKIRKKTAEIFNRTQNRHKEDEKADLKENA